MRLKCPICKSYEDFNDIDFEDFSVLICEGCGNEFEVTPTGKVYKEGE